MIRGETYFTEALAGVSDEVRRQVELNMDISDRIASILKEKGMNRRDFAGKMHCSEAEVSRWLSGSHNFTLRTIARISAALGEDLVTVAK